ncbi:MAG: Gfo/Idh/MocA family protein [Marvinbryantia sp.]|jgi:predicted dehydrogenase
MKMGILGAGNIAKTMARTIREMPEVTSWAVASRNLEKAQAFADEFGFVNAYGSYEELVSDPEIDLIYVATPHSHHFAHAKLCVEHGKAVLVEKAFTQNALQAKELLTLAKKKKVFVTEAIWTRYMPSRKIMDDLIAEGVIGTPYSLYATLSYPIADKERIAQPELAGGALLDIGIYALNFASMIFGDDVKEQRVEAILSDKGVDLAENITLIYNDNKMAVLHSDVRVSDNREGAVYGDKGCLIVQNINNCERITVFNNEHKIVRELEVPKQITGYEYEVLACMEALEKGLLECPQMPHAQTIHMMEVMDELRRKMGVVYPGEN